MEDANIKAPEDLDRFLDSDFPEDDESEEGRGAGRPTDYTPEFGDRICALIASGSSLRKVCLRDWAPHHKTIFRWFRKHPDFLRSYEMATEIRTELYADEMVSIADDDSRDIGFKESTDKDGKGAKPVILIDNIHRARLQVQTRQWICERMKPKRFGRQPEIVNAYPEPMVIMGPEGQVLSILGCKETLGTK